MIQFTVDYLCNNDSAQFLEKLLTCLRCNEWGSNELFNVGGWYSARQGDLPVNDLDCRDRVVVCSWIESPGLSVKLVTPRIGHEHILQLLD